MNSVSPNRQPQSKHITPRLKALSPLQLDKKFQGNGHAVLLDEGKGKTKRLLCLFKIRKSTHGVLLHETLPTTSP